MLLLLFYQIFLTFSIAFLTAFSTAPALKFIIDMLKAYKKEQDAERIRLGSKWVDHDRLFVKWNGEPMNNNTQYSGSTNPAKSTISDSVISTASDTLMQVSLSMLE